MGHCVTVTARITCGRARSTQATYLSTLSRQPCANNAPKRHIRASRFKARSYPKSWRAGRSRTWLGRNSDYKSALIFDIPLKCRSKSLGTELRRSFMNYLQKSYRFDLAKACRAVILQTLSSSSGLAIPSGKIITETFNEPSITHFRRLGHTLF